MASEEDVARDFVAEMRRELLGWSGSPEDARELRRRLREAPPLGERSREPQEGAVHDIVEAYRSARCMKLIKKARRASFQKLLAAVLGDPAMGPWPFSDPYRIADGEVVDALRFVDRCGVVEEEARVFVRVLYLTRRRSTWVPAADALARLALRDEACCDFLVAEWRTFFPGGLPKKSWPAGGFDAFRPPGVAEGKVVHRVRHLLRAVGAWLAMKGGASVFPGLSAAALAKPALPNSPSDASAVWLALQPLLTKAPPHDELVGAAVARVSETPADEQADDVLRAIVGVLPATHPLVSAMEAHLVEPGWLGRSGSELSGALVSWVHTAVWARARGREDLVDQMRASSHGGAKALSLGLDGAIPGEEPLGSLLERLRCLLDGNAYLTTPPARRYVSVAETLLLLAHPELAELPRARLMARALGHVETQCLDPREVAVLEGEGALTLAISGWAPKDVPQRLLRDTQLSKSDVLALAECGDARVDIQVAVHMERMLREAPDDAGRVRLLWELLWRARSGKLFVELADVSREDPAASEQERAQTLGGRIAAVARAAEKLVGARSAPPSAASHARITADFSSVLSALIAVPWEAPGGEAAWVVGLLRGVQSGLGALPGAFPEPAIWLQRLEALLLGGGATSDAQDTRQGGLLGLLAWHGESTASLSDRWVALSHAVRAGAAATWLSSEQGADIGEAAAALREALAVAPWPVARLSGAQLNALLRWRDQLLEEAVHHQQAIRELEDALAQNELNLVAELGPSLVPTLPVATVQRVHRFLLFRGRLAAAGGVREALLGRELNVVRDLAGEALEEAISRSATPEVVDLASDVELFPRDVPLRNAHAYLVRIKEVRKADRLRRRAGEMARDVIALVNDAIEIALELGDKERVVALIADGEALPSPGVALRAHDFLLDRDGDEEARTLRENLSRAGRDIVDLQESALDNAINDRDEARVVEAIKEGCEVLPEPSVRRAYDFLLNALNIPVARYVRAVAKTRGIHLPALFIGVRTLIFGVVAGTVMVLDFGIAWNELIKKMLWGQAAVVTLTCFALAFSVLASEVIQHSARTPEESKRGYAKRIVWRVLPIFLGASLYAAGISQAALFSLRGTSVFVSGTFAQCALWTGLSLFFGLFMGLLLPGRRFLVGK